MTRRPVISPVPLLHRATATASRRAVALPVTVASGKSYQVLIGERLDPTPFVTGRRALVLRDRRLRFVWPGPKPASLALPSGEPCKSFAVFRRVIDFVIRHDDGSPLVLVAFGGGSVGDLTGFAAATYRRGIPFVQMPTTLLAMVDASVGGKTAINHPLAKNMIGAFHQPDAVLADLERLATLPTRELRSGLAEVVKHGLIADTLLFSRLEREPTAFARGERDALAFAVERSVRVKARVVGQDERESRGIREVLNFGHTLGHAIEAVKRFRGVTHGEGVAVGMVAAAIVSEKLLGFTGRARVESLVKSLGLPTRLKGLSARKLIEATRKDKKRRTGKLRMTLLKEIGSTAVLDNIDEHLLLEAARELGAGR